MVLLVQILFITNDLATISHFGRCHYKRYFVSTSVPSLLFENVRIIVYFDDMAEYVTVCGAKFLIIMIQFVVVLQTRNNAIAWNPREPMNFTAVCGPRSN